VTRIRGTLRIGGNKGFAKVGRQRVLPSQIGRGRVFLGTRQLVWGKREQKGQRDTKNPTGGVPDHGSANVGAGYISIRGKG